ncbi:MAG: tetratricopeptide repeat protein [Tenuifilaceae bacterium]
MRLILTLTTFLTMSVGLFAQGDYFTLDKLTYDQYLKGDYKNLKKTADKALLQGIDFYYLRLRIGILAYNNQRYAIAVKHFNKALDFNSWDAISREYIYYSYLLSGRKADANIYLSSIPQDKRSNTLKQISEPGLSEVFINASFSSYNSKLYSTNSLYYEAVDNGLGFNLGFESYFSNKFKGTFAYTNYRKNGIVYSSTNTDGVDLNFSQNQIYAKLTGLSFPGWEISGFGHLAFYPNVTTTTQFGGRQQSMKQTVTDYLVGVAISKNSWRIRGGLNVSFSNLGNSNQLRGEGYLTYLPFGNLNLYLTSGGMFQTDKHWGETYQINQEIGFKAAKFLWLEAGVVQGNSFLYGRSQGYSLNNSFQIPSSSVYGNIIILPSSRFSITISPFITQIQDYSWDLDLYTRTDKQSNSSIGGLIKLTFKNK